jgi:translation initiation factor IF-1
MVKNTGGNKAKGYARKNMASGSNQHALRLSTDPAEVYAQTVKILGGALCRVIDINGNEMTCHIRGKFRGRSKRNNLISSGTWLLVGLREWEKEPSVGKLLNCDLIEVYSDSDKDRLKNIVTSVNWSLFITNDTKTINSSYTNDDIMGEIQFSNKAQEYEELISAQLEATKTDTNKIINTDNDTEINVDDI